MNIRILLKKWFDTPSFLIRDKVIVWPEKIKGVVTNIQPGCNGWDYYVEFSEPAKLGEYMRPGWWLSGRSLTIPYVEDLIKWEEKNGN